MFAVPLGRTTTVSIATLNLPVIHCQPVKECTVNSTACKEPFIKSTPVKTNHRLHDDHKSAHLETVICKRAGTTTRTGKQHFITVFRDARGCTRDELLTGSQTQAHHSSVQAVCSSLSALYVQGVSQ